MLFYKSFFTSFVCHRASDLGNVKALKALNELIGVLYEGHWDESDIMTDYFHCAYYVDVSIGKWNKPYKVSA